jgi:hypothetical protein
VVVNRAAKNGNRRKRVNRVKHVRLASRANRVVDVKAVSLVKHAKAASRARHVKDVNRASRVKYASRVNRVRTAVNAVVNARRKALKPPIAVNAASVGNVRNGANVASPSRKPPSKH